MTFLNGAGIIDDALTIIRNDSTSVRANMLSWLNIASQKLVVARPTRWTFLENGSVYVTPDSNNALTMPADYEDLISLQGGTDFLLDKRNLLTPGEAWEEDNSSVGQAMPYGYTEAVGLVVTTVGPPAVYSRGYIITLHGAAYANPVTVNYSISPTDFTDDTTESAWPSACLPIFQRTLLDGFYEYDFDERAAISYQLNQQLLSQLKQWDNMRKPRSQTDQRGLRRSR